MYSHLSQIAAHSDKAADVRKFIQKLNLTRGQAAEHFDEQNLQNASQATVDDHTDLQQPPDPQQHLDSGQAPHQSKWASYAAVVESKYKRPSDSLEDIDMRTDETFADDNFITALPDSVQKRRKGASRSVDVREHAAPKKGRRRLDTHGRFKSKVDSSENESYDRRHLENPTSAPSHSTKSQWPTTNGQVGLNASMSVNHPRSDVRKTTPRSRGSAATKSRWNVLSNQVVSRTPVAADGVNGGDIAFTSLGDEIVVEEEANDLF